MLKCLDHELIGISLPVVHWEISLQFQCVLVLIIFFISLQELLLLHHPYYIWIHISLPNVLNQCRRKQLSILEKELSTPLESHQKWLDHYAPHCVFHIAWFQHIDFSVNEMDTNLPTEWKNLLSSSLHITVRVCVWPAFYIYLEVRIVVWQL